MNACRIRTSPALRLEGDCPPVGRSVPSAGRGPASVRRVGAAHAEDRALPGQGPTSRAVAARPRARGLAVTRRRAGAVRSRRAVFIRTAIVFSGVTPMPCPESQRRRRQEPCHPVARHAPIPWTAARLSRSTASIGLDAARSPAEGDRLPVECRRAPTGLRCSCNQGTQSWVCMTAALAFMAESRCQHGRSLPSAGRLSLEGRPPIMQSKARRSCHACLRPFTGLTAFMPRHDRDDATV